MQKVITIATHNGNFHADDVFAVACILLSINGSEYEIVRTRDKSKIDTSDWAVDVCGKYDAETLRFDHHQNTVPKRKNGIPYAAFGLVWKHLGEKLCKNAESAELIDRRLVQDIDASDNGVANYESIPNFFGLSPYTPKDLIEAFRARWNEKSTEEDKHARFIKAVNFAKDILSREIIRATGDVEACEFAKKIYETSKEKSVLIFDRSISSDVASQFSDTLAIIAPHNSEWTIRTVPISPRSFSTRANFPKEWGGLRDEELQKVSGIEDAIFCHKSLNMAFAKTLDGAKKIASKISWQGDALPRNTL